jgi:hypothetical protein
MLQVLGDLFVVPLLASSAWLMQDKNCSDLLAYSQLSVCAVPCAIFVTSLYRTLLAHVAARVNKFVLYVCLALYLVACFVSAKSIASRNGKTKLHGADALPNDIVLA